MADKMIFMLCIEREKRVILVKWWESSSSIPFIISKTGDYKIVNNHKIITLKKNYSYSF